MTTAPLQTFEPDGRAIAYIDEGTGPAVILIPETGQDIASLGTLASILIEEDFRVLRLAPLDVTADMSGLAQAVVDIMDAVGLEHPQKRLNLARVTRGLDDECVGRNVDDASAEQVDGLEHL